MDFINLASIALGLVIAMTAAWAIQRMTGASDQIVSIQPLAPSSGG